ncbi:hypothetical protein JOF53_002678 [Crossiella equi]|uniref:Uncharacterized protein n=1 Tax=Crossiella equi TaxID=130796 RepID=A0ABS5AB48_9PSEU|nr:hypothetical protein [Crossiella equi]MBP2473806.1 hypothetical protein [Crossiella equi]
MRIPEADTMAELIEDCAAIPSTLRPGDHLLPAPRREASWQVSEACSAQVRGMDDYGA